MNKYFTILFLLILTPFTSTAQESKEIFVLVDLSQYGAADSRVLAMKEWLQILPAQNQSITIGGFDGSFHTILTSQKLESELSRLDILSNLKLPESSSNYCDLSLGLYQAMKLFSSDEKSQKSVILLSDGNIYLHGSESNEDLNRQSAKVLIRDLAPKFKEKKISIFPITFSSKVNFEFMSELANTTGGGLFRADRYQRRLWSRLFLDIYDQALKPIDYQSRKATKHFSPGLEEIIFTLSKSSIRDGFALTSPDELIYSSMKPKKNKNARWFISEKYVILTILDPAPGDWLIETAVSAAHEVKAYINPKLEIILPKKEIPAGHALRVKAQLKSFDEVINDAALSATMNLQARMQKIDGGSKTVLGKLSIDELTGEFGADFPGTFGSGKRTVYVTAKGRTFSREESGSIEFQPEWLFVKLASDSGYANHSLPVQAILDLDIQKFERVEVNALVENPEGKIKSFELGAVIDGTFAEDINAFNQLGEYKISVEISGLTDEGIAFERVSKAAAYHVKKDPSLGNVVKATTTTQVVEVSANVDSSSNAPPLHWLVILQTLIVGLTAVFMFLLYKKMNAEESQVALYELMQNLKSPVAESVELAAGSQIRLRSRKRKSMATNDDFENELSKMKEMFGDDDDSGLDDIPDFGFGDVFGDGDDARSESVEKNDEPEAVDIGDEVSQPQETEALNKDDESEVLDELFAEDVKESTESEADEEKPGEEKS